MEYEKMPYGDEEGRDKNGLAEILAGITMVIVAIITILVCLKGAELLAKWFLNLFLKIVEG